MSAGSYKLIQNLGKELIELKLTDSCVKAIEKFVKIEKTAHSLNIDFSKGTLTIPGEDDSNPQVYNFKLLKNNNKVVDCYKLDEEILEENVMQRMGKISMSMRIGGKDDSYVATKRKMNLAIENEQKSVTKVVKTVMNSKKRKAKAISLFENTIYRPNRTSFFKKETLLQAQKSANEKKPKFEKVLSSVSSTQPVNKSIPDKISESLIHFLALAPSSFSKLFLKFSSLFGQPNRHTFKQELLKVANVNIGGPETTYKLKECNYSKVNTNWKSYTENEKLILEESLEKLENKKLGNNNLKRKLETPPSKPCKEKKRALVMKKQIQPLKPKVTKAVFPSRNSSVASSCKVNDKTNNNRIKILELPTFQSSSSSSSELKKIENVMAGKKASSSKSGRIFQSNFNSKSSNVENECDQNITKNNVFLQPKLTLNGDYKSKFTSITTDKQRYEYKAVFDQEYKLYLQLHKKIASASQKFEEYQKKVNGLPLSELSQLKKTIYAEFNKLKKDKDYNDSRARYDNLHVKLDYIKGLIHEYDKSKRERKLN